ncbi:hypothetical protein ACT2CQ_00615 [Candidatus Karelsulcia muelleri]
MENMLTLFKLVISVKKEKTNKSIDLGIKMCTTKNSICNIGKTNQQYV